MRCTFARRDRTVVTGFASALGLIMVDRGYRRPRCCTVTGLAHVCRRDMRGRFTGSGNMIVATDTRLAANGAVVKGDIPVQGVVAGIAGRSGLDMGGVFTAGNDTIVTTLTGAEGMIVIDTCRRCPGAWRMTGFAHIASVDMV